MNCAKDIIIMDDEEEEYELEQETNTTNYSQKSIQNSDCSEKVSPFENNLTKTTNVLSLEDIENDRKHVANTFKTPLIPTEWVTPQPNISSGEPNFDTLDNPGCWTSFVYRPVYEVQGT